VSPDNPKVNPPSDQFVQSLARGLSVIRAFDSDHASLTLSEVAARTGLARAVARRFLLTLESLNYVRSNGRQYELTGLVLELGYAYLSSQPLAQLASPFLAELAAQTSESTSISTLDNTDIVYIARVQKRQIMQFNISIGSRVPATTSSMGRVLLASLSEEEFDRRFVNYQIEQLTPRTITSKTELKQELASIAKKGWAMVDQELQIGVRSIAVPIHDNQQKVIAAINVSWQLGLNDSKKDRDEQVAEFLPQLQKTAAQLEHVSTKSGLLS
jgi:IclR family pca regulon transcriptional regulator